MKPEERRLKSASVFLTWLELEQWLQSTGAELKVRLIRRRAHVIISYPNQGLPLSGKACTGEAASLEVALCKAMQAWEER